MMHGREKSDPAMVAEKSANKDGRPSAESAEPRAGPRETRDSAACAGLRAGKACPTGRTVYGKRRRNGNRNGSPPCYIMSNVDLLRSAFGWLRKEAAAGVDGVTWKAYGEGLDDKLVDRRDLSTGAQPSRRA